MCAFQEPPTMFSSKNNDKSQNGFIYNSGEKDEEKAPNNGCNLQQGNTKKSSFITPYISLEMLLQKVKTCMLLLFFFAFTQENLNLIIFYFSCLSFM